MVSAKIKSKEVLTITLLNFFNFEPLAAGNLFMHPSGLIVKVPNDTTTLPISFQTVRNSFAISADDYSIFRVSMDYWEFKYQKDSAFLFFRIKNEKIDLEE